MKTFYYLILFLLLNIFFCELSYSQIITEDNNSNVQSPATATHPLYELRVTNLFEDFNFSAGTSAITFDIYIYHTNPQDSGPFLFASGQYFLQFNPAVANGGTLTYEIISNTTQFSNPDAVPINPSISGNQLRLMKNLPLTVSNAPIVSTAYPGTRVASLKLTSTSPTIDIHQLNLSWMRRINNDYFTGIFAFVDTVYTNVSDSGTYIVDSVGVVAPVELSGFISSIERNNVLLNWSTASELNNSGFDVERCDENEIWQKIGFVQGFGTISSSKNYSFEDRQLNPGKYKYRLRQVDFNGNFEYFILTNEINIGAPETFSLKQNYPNPFNPNTKIDFDIPQNAYVSLKLYDINGREVRTLVNEFKNPGYYSIDLNAADLPSGVYYYIFNSGNFHSTKKLILLK